MDRPDFNMGIKKVIRDTVVVNNFEEFVKLIADNYKVVVDFA